MTSDIAIVVVASALNALLGIIVVLRNPRKAANIAFGLFGSTIILWSICNYLADHAVYTNLAYSRLTVLFGSCIVASFVYLSMVFPHKVAVGQRLTSSIKIATLINALLCCTDLYVASVHMSNSVAVLHVGPLYSLFVAYMLFMTAAGFYVFARQLRNAERVAKSRLKLLLLGILLYASFAIPSNVLLPLLLDNWTSTKYGPAFTVPFVAITGYAIVKHRLFDVRSVVVRILGYLLTLSILAVVYSLFVTFIISKIVLLDSLSVPQLAALAIPTLLSILTFPYLKHRIDKITARIFYRDMYVSREVLDALSKQLISQNDVNSLLHGSMHVLTRALHPSSFHMVVFDDKGKVFTDYSARRRTPINASSLTDLLRKTKEPVISRDDHEGSRIAEALEASGSDLAVRLQNGEKLIGVILFGHKKSGSIYTNQDIKLLRVAANNLSVALDNAKKYEQIQNFADTLKEEVAHATLRLRHANERLKTLDQLKDDFISMASHQFRTPVGSIRQALQIINDPATSQKDQREMLHLAEVDSEHLSTIVATMLSISRLQAGRFLIDKSPTDLSALLDAVMRGVGILAQQKNIQVNLHRPDGPLMMAADSAKLKEAMTNYIENAIKYSPAGATVTVTLSQTDDAVVFEVADRGIGIPGDERKQLFTKFYRAPNARREQPEGNGIGLYVVKNIAELHGGIAYHKPAEPGSIFGFSLPLSTAGGHSRSASAYEPLAQSPTIIE